MSLFTLSKTGYISDPILNMRRAPSLESEVVSQALFGEEVSCLKAEGPWIQIETPDRYSGWVLQKDIPFTSKKYEPNGKIARLSAPIYQNPSIKRGPSMVLPLGVGVTIVSEIDSEWSQIELPTGDLSYIQKGNLTSSMKTLSKEELSCFSQQFLNIPYVWGGRSSFGFDCSGFVQFLYSHLKILLPRDSSQQANDPRLQRVEEKEMRKGDLIFWGPIPDKIMHTGMYIGDGAFIHASARENLPWLRISRLTDAAWAGKAGSIYPFRIFKSLF